MPERNGKRRSGERLQSAAYTRLCIRDSLSAVRNESAAPRLEPAPVRAPAPAPVPRVLPRRREAPLAKPAAQPGRRFLLFYAALFIVCAVFMGRIVLSYAQLTKLSKENSAMRSEITSLKKEQSALGLVQSKKISTAEIEQLAKEYGMVKPTGSAVKLLVPESSDVYELCAEGAGDSMASFLWCKLKDGAGVVWDFIN